VRQSRDGHRRQRAVHLVHGPLRTHGALFATVEGVEQRALRRRDAPRKAVQPGRGVEIALDGQRQRAHRDVGLLEVVLPALRRRHGGRLRDQRHLRTRLAHDA
jgi:hypothetical protein